MVSLGLLLLLCALIVIIIFVSFSLYAFYRVWRGPSISSDLGLILFVLNIVVLVVLLVLLFAIVYNLLTEDRKTEISDKYSESINSPVVSNSPALPPIRRAAEADRLEELIV